MNNYELLEDEAAKCDVDIVYRNFAGRFKGLYCDRIIALDARLNQSEKTSVLAEELGHYHTSIGDIIDQKNVENRKQERHARIWAFQKIVPLSKIFEAHLCGCCNRYEMSKYLDVSEEFLQEAINYYMG